MRAEVSSDSEAMPGVSMRIIDLRPVERPPDVDPVDLLGGHAAEVEHEAALLAPDRHAPRLARRAGAA